MYKISTLTAILLISVSSGVVQAKSNFTLGAGVGVVEHPYKDYDTDIYPVPVIDYESEHFWFSGLEGVITCGTMKRINCRSWRTGLRFILSLGTVMIASCAVSTSEAVP